MRAVGSRRGRGAGRAGKGGAEFEGMGGVVLECAGSESGREGSKGASVHCQAGPKKPLIERMGKRGKGWVIRVNCAWRAG
jgi:hypothetical protein